MINWLKKWNIVRLLRFILGIMIIFQGIDAKQWVMVALGTFFALLPVLNIGCCGSSSCNTAFSTKKRKQNNETTYTEVK